MSEPIPSDFMEALQSLRGHRFRSEVHLEEIPAPTRIAPFALALNGEVNPTRDPDEMLGHGRFIVLHDPATQPAWHGTFRVIVMAKAPVDPEMGIDPMFGEAGWSWLLDALDGAGAGYHSLSGTVTRVLSETFGGLLLQSNATEMEVRASWSPKTTDLGPHLTAWVNLLAALGGLPPVAENVAVLGRRVR
ncbi:MAG TPA: DUF3000 domain-containing protein [Actinomycetaceae bacterium]|nr:DUF3000 domain-containing protein [Actinomycetaceae bacterium]